MRKCTCCTCGKQYNLKTGEYNRKIKLKSKFYCSLSCSGKAPRHNPASKSDNNKQHLATICGNRRDQYTPFRLTLRKCKGRHKVVSITLQDIKSQWDKQGGICPYLGVQLSLTDTTNPNLIASLDRIDSNKGYIPGNIQFISLTLNYAKNQYPESVLLDLIQMIKDPGKS